jgi:tetratricopeptide (TPR) repeat protein
VKPVISQADLRARISSLRLRRSDLKHQGNFAEALRLQEEIIRLREGCPSPADEVANDWNYLAIIQHSLGSLAEAEEAARRSLAHYIEHTTQRDENLATYYWVMATILADQDRSTEAVTFGEEALACFALRHGEDEFMQSRRRDLERMRRDLW